MNGNSVKGNYKVPGGKLLKVEFEVEAGTIANFSLTGDFFLYPEDGVDLINESLNGCKLERKEIEERIGAAITHNSLNPVGFSPADLASAILATKEEK